jgi:hypothetical protein
MRLGSGVQERPKDPVKVRRVKKVASSILRNGLNAKKSIILM